MKAIRLSDAASKLNELVELLPSSGDVVLTRGDAPVARLTTPDKQPTLRDIQPSSVGTILSPLLDANDDLLAEMLDR